ncbi:MAG: transglutaminase family protein [Cyclobacteriaceae bacterium]
MTKRFRIKHTTEYKYDSPVFSEPHHLYFYPLQRDHQQTIDCQIAIYPAPAGTSVRLDVENNTYMECLFGETTNRLRIDAEILIETRPFNAFGYLLETAPKTAFDEVIRLYASGVAMRKEAMEWLKTYDQTDVSGFVGDLCRAIHDKWPHTTSEDPELCNPNTCFLAEEASCRDLAWLMINMLRALGYAARFVSGYSYNPELTGHELHAWVEVWLPGAGWIGLDPTAGLFVTESYFPVAASYHPTNTLPVQGSYRGKADSKLETKVEIVRST